MAKQITKVIRLKITKPIIPTSSWKEFHSIMKTLHEEVRIASNKVISYCNFYYSNQVNDTDYLQNKKLSNELYRIAREYSPSLQSYNSNSISREIENRYFSGLNSYKIKIENGEGNPPMGYKKDIPIPIADKNSFKIIPLENGQYNFAFPLVSTSFKKNWNAEAVKKNPEECFKMTDGIFVVGIDATNGSVKSILERCLSGEYKMGGSKLVKKDNKYYINLVYSFAADKTNSSLINDYILGVDLGCAVPAFVAVNYNSYSRNRIGGDYIIKEKLKYERLLDQAKHNALIECKGGHGRNSKVKLPNNIRHKKSNYTETCNRRIAKVIVDSAIKFRCSVIHMEDLSGFHQSHVQDKFLKQWTYYQLQLFVEQKAAQANIKVEYVNPKHTSQTCSKCGHVDPLNRPKGEFGASYFKCTKCGFSTHADFNAARNIAMKEPNKKKDKEVA